MPGGGVLADVILRIASNYACTHIAACNQGLCIVHSGTACGCIALRPLYTPAMHCARMHSGMDPFLPLLPIRVTGNLLVTRNNTLIGTQYEAFCTSSAAVHAASVST